MDAATCAARIADVDATVASLLQAMQTEYATLLAAAPTAAEKTAVSKAQADATAALRAWRDSVLASINKTCNQLK
jgi:predicted negative regulator of RcsB-dependent stress response